MNKWLQENWKEYKKAVASRSPRFVEKIIQNKHFEKFIVYEIIVILIFALVAIATIGRRFGWRH